ncbi:MAG: hypothetical protein IPM42_06700 [Saprospiraceae bacterium]|nr:hypothetical protein [Saprospiraceae bacterium]
MSKDKGSKNRKTAPADKNAIKKEGSDYKNEGKNRDKTTADPLTSKLPGKSAQKV